ncbi:putative sensor domain DACNV-containing protein [Chitinophaga japonensis]|uniref:Probable sensor domain-containing protein n=1 Tax=Chitinophaga japonensis TaxID=104662 RepID=A0A562SZI0_CHIJA|nr:hypothetical protein [Chitinophaga japonensis]TWI86699.1 hypothetical protein LX66_3962 [Chitinophaga japonensis]
MELIHETTYQAAAKVSDVIETHFLKHLAAAKENGEEDLACLPDAKIVEKIIDVAFWASLRKEEGTSTKISLAFLKPSQAGKPLLFERRLPLNSKVLSKLAPGVERAGVHVGIWHDDGELYIWGTTIKLPNYCFVLDVSEPALLVVKQRRIIGLGKFTNVAVLRGDQVKVVDENTGLLPDSPAILTSLLGLSSSALWSDPVNVLIQIAVGMRAHGRGGILLVTPSAHENWRASIIHPLQYAVHPAFTGVTDLVQRDCGKASDIYWQNALKREVENITGLTAVDGATVINDRHSLLTFGAKIARADYSTPVEQMQFMEPVIGGSPILIHPSSIGGTRHLSAAQFVHDQHDALALVASQDGYFTVFSWSEQAQVVQAHRIDVLLL